MARRRQTMKVKELTPVELTDGQPVVITKVEAEVSEEKKASSSSSSSSAPTTVDVEEEEETKAGATTMFFSAIPGGSGVVSGDFTGAAASYDSSVSNPCASQIGCPCPYSSPNNDASAGQEPLSKRAPLGSQPLRDCIVPPQDPLTLLKEAADEPIHLFHTLAVKHELRPLQLQLGFTRNVLLSHPYHIAHILNRPLEFPKGNAQTRLFEETMGDPANAGLFNSDCAHWKVSRPLNEGALPGPVGACPMGHGSASVLGKKCPVGGSKDKESEDGDNMELEYLHKRINFKAKYASKLIKEELEDGNHVEITSIMNSYMLDVFGLTMFSEDYAALGEESVMPGFARNDDMAGHLRTLMGYLKSRKIQTVDGLTWLKKLPTPGNLIFNSAVRKVREHWSELIEERTKVVHIYGEKERSLKGVDPNRERNILAEFLKNKGGSTLPNDEIVNEMFSIILSGTFTTQEVIQYTLLELMNHRDDAMRQVKGELLEHALADDDLSVETVGKLTWLHAAIGESCRIHPIASVLVRRTDHSVVLPGLPRRDDDPENLSTGYLIPADTEILINVFTPQVWRAFHPLEETEHSDDVEKEEDESPINMTYNIRHQRNQRAPLAPYGKMPECGDKLHQSLMPFSYYPFGRGPRSCPGYTLSSHSAKLFLAHVIRDLNLKVAPGFVPKPVMSATMPLESGLYVVGTNDSTHEVARTQAKRNQKEREVQRKAQNVLIGLQKTKKKEPRK